MVGISELEKKTRDAAAGVFVTEGVLVALFGIAALFWPGLSVALFIALFGIFVLVWGVTGLAHSFLGIGRSGLWWVETVFSVLVIALGVFVLRNPESTLSIVILLVGFTLVVRGIVDVVVGLFDNDRDVRENRGIYIALGALGVLAGIVILLYPVASGLVFVWALGFYMLMYGAMKIGLAFRVRSSS